MVTAATILRMTEERKYQELLANGIDTKLSDILPILKQHYPHSSYIQTELEFQPNFAQITFRHLAQHTSGLARVSRDALDTKLHETNRKLAPEEMIDAAKSQKTGKYGKDIRPIMLN